MQRQQVERQRQHLGSQGDAQGHHEHVGHGVLEAQCHKSRYGEPHGDRFAGGAAGSIGHVDRSAHQPIAQNAARERLSPTGMHALSDARTELKCGFASTCLSSVNAASAAFQCMLEGCKLCVTDTEADVCLREGEAGLGDSDVERGGSCGHQPSGNHKIHHQQRACKVAQVREYPVLCQLAQRRLPLKHLSCNIHKMSTAGAHTRIGCFLSLLIKHLFDMLFSWKEDCDNEQYHHAAFTMAEPERHGPSDDSMVWRGAYRGSDKGGVAGEQLCAAHEHQQEAKGQSKSAIHHLLQSRICGRQAGAGSANGESQEAAKANEGTPQNAHDERLGNGQPCLGGTRHCRLHQAL